MLPLAKKLVSRGHNVTIYTEVYAPMGEWGDGVQAHYVILPPESGNPEYDEEFFSLIWNLEFDPQIMTPTFQMGSDAFKAALKEDAFWQIYNESWDLTISDELFDATGYSFGLTKKRDEGRPHVLMSTTQMLATFTSVMSLGVPQALIPSYYTRHEPLKFSPLDFFDRLYSIRLMFVELLYIGCLAEWDTAAVVRLLGYADFTWRRYYNDLAVVFSDYPERLAYPVPQGNDVIPVGSVCPAVGEMPDDLRAFVDDPTSKGTIYVGFGTLMRWDVAPVWIIEAFVEALNELSDYRVVWAFNGNRSLPVQQHVRLLKWAPQTALLSHSKTRIFISHGGLKSVKEAICSETPVIYMPFFAEQTRSALIAVELGFAEYLNKLSFDADEMVVKMKKMLANNDVYERNIVRLKAFFLDRIIDPLEEGAFWVEKQIRFGARPTVFKRRGILLKWGTFLYLDLLSLLFGIFVLIGGSCRSVVVSESGRNSEQWLVERLVEEK